AAPSARRNGGCAVKIGDQSLSVDPENSATRPALANYVGKMVVVGIRPEELEDAALNTSAPADRRLRGKTELTEALGSEIMVHFTIEAKQAMTEDVRELAPAIGDDRLTAQ